MKKTYEYIITGIGLLFFGYGAYMTSYSVMAIGVIMIFLVGLYRKQQKDKTE